MNDLAKPLPFDAERVRADFPILNQEVNGHPLVYLDNAATTQKPRAVIQALVDYYEQDNSNVHRGAHALADRATQKFEAARAKVAAFINAPEARQVIWTRGTTESINLVASSWGRANLQAGDRVLVSAMEHHSNIVPWQLIAAEKGASVEPIPVDADGTLDMAALESMLDERVRLVACGHVSNALGTVNPVADIVRLAHAAGALVLIDGAQAVSHWPVDVQALDCDFYVFSAHKLFGPTGLGVLYGKRALLEAMPPYQGGGEMIETVSFAGTTFNQLPYKFEAGTPDIAGVIAFGAAIDYLNQLDRVGAAAHEQALLTYAEERARATPGIRLVGTSAHKTSVMSFLLEGAHPNDVGMLLDQQGVAVRTGNHCAQPIMEQFGIPGTVRASLAFYNTRADVDRLFEALEKVRQFLI
ncbi:MAG: cysteine desulfurase CsdA [Pseudomonadales bacterium]|jgi:cysteine desulfurase/selenocysteine lyase|uniref:aminotransferase class V-fold PLP-dependent enzyme n=1 Tax=Halopseudomonas TaxID=2901189 RepID=UPI000C468B8F|nr:cysteine desulfurase [Halopseudomonas aestusnigri]MAH01195.1 cysteine desulfurase CsdA [Pseudomonadales bacterium]HBT57885.1 cysteine desulfurase CsdA [Pseudomonas sp.]MAK75209.1 cysteine desulfurase CsdA [Pseudomonadales bacterium]MAP76769.1 cysteine desulfurase CsdA [Pseudomonadales bacterium]MAY07385.1 cysteine desulfurase CsdA [Pseudomonadales bacterium]|tara:strand:+ start:5993 stop:7234 length:1242 start_codon:yes stop_codon:yes gene_type:complete